MLSLKSSGSSFSVKGRNLSAWCMQTHYGRTQAWTPPFSLPGASGTVQGVLIHQFYTKKKKEQFYQAT